VNRVHLVTGIVERDGCVLCVASRYPNHAEPLWNLPGGRQRPGELLDAALRREFLEETGLAVEVGSLQYVAESYDPLARTHFTNACFAVYADGEPHLPPGDAHAVALAWVTRDELATRLTVAVVREPLLAHLRGDPRRYFGFADAGITVEFADPP
jgi:8-oxo-dGTP diphosphatase